MMRYAKIDDLPAIVDIYNTTIATRLVTADTEPVSVESRFAWFEAHNTSTRPLFVQTDEAGKVFAWLSFQDFYGRPAYQSTAEISIYIAPEYRGAGGGKFLLKYALDVANDYGIKTILGFIFAQNEASLGLFAQFGFAQWANLPQIAVLDGKPCDLIIMGKKV